MTDIVDKKRSKRLLARFKKPGSRSVPESEIAIESESARTTVPAASTPNVPASVGTENLDKSTESKRTRRQEAEDELKAAAGVLNKAMSKVSERIPVPEALTLEHIDHVDDVEGTAKEIIKTIDKFIAERRPDMTLQSKAVWKGCVKRWYLAAYPYVKPCLNAVNDIVPSPYSIVVKGMLYILQSLYDAGQMAAEVEVAMKTLSDTLRDAQVTDGFSEVLDEKQLDEVHCAALRLSTAIIEYLAKAILYLESNKRETLKNIFTGSDFTAAKTKIDTAATAYVKSMGFLTAQMAAQLLLHDKDENREKMLNWLSSGDDINWQRHWDLHKRRVPGTGMWLLESDQFKDWQKGKGSPLLFSGSGKSFMASTVIDHLVPFTNNLNRHKVAVLVVYCQYDSRNRQTSENLVRTLSKQIIYQLGVIPDSLQTAYDRSKREGMSMQPNETTFFSLLVECVERFSSVFLVIDAFDECAEDQRPIILKWLQLLLIESRLRIFLTSRPHVRDSPDFYEDDEMQRWLRESNALDIIASQSDIKIYLHDRLKTVKRCDEQLKNKLVTTISTKAQGQFLLAEFQLNYVLEFLCQPKKLDKALTKLPTAVGKLYEDVMRRIEEAGETRRDLAWRTLSWIVHAVGTRPLKMNELRQLLVLDVGDTQIDERQSSTEDILAVCQSLIALDAESNVVRFAHFTVQEFLTEKYTHYKLLPRKELAKVCVTYITLAVFETGPTDEEAFYRRAETHLSYDYAVKYWGYYTRGDGENDPELQSALLKLFKSPSKRAALRQREILMQIDEWWRYEIWSLSTSQLSTWEPIHIMAHEGLTIFYNYFASSAHKEEIDMGTVQSRDNYRSTAFIEAAKSGYTDMITLLLEAGAGIEAKDINGRTSLSWAAENGDAEVVRRLLEAGADIEAKDEDGWTSLIWAASYGHAEMVKQLLEAGAYIEAKDEDGQTSLIWAARNRKDEMVKQLLEAGADRNRKAEMVKQLLEAGADIEAKDINGRTLLSWAAENGDAEVVRRLLEAGADIEAKDKDGWTSLIWTTIHEKAEMVKQLLEAGADIEAKDEDGRTSLIWTTMHEKAEMVKQLLEAGADIEAKDKDGWTSLIRAAYYGHAEMVKQLLEAGADIEAKEKDGRTSLICAAYWGHAETVKQLLEAGADTTGLVLWHNEVGDRLWQLQGLGTGYWHESN